MDVPGLTDPVAAVLCLGVHGGIPVTVVEDHRVGASQVDAHATAASRQDEAENSAICVEALHESLEEVEEKEETFEKQSHHCRLVLLCVWRPLANSLSSGSSGARPPVSAPPGCCRPGGGRCVRGS